MLNLIIPYLIMRLYMHLETEEMHARVLESSAVKDHDADRCSW